MKRSPTGERPKLDLPFSRAEIVVGGLTVAGLLAELAVAVWAFLALPERIPIHFDAAGRADGWGGKGFLLALPLIAAMTVVPLLFLRRFPHVYNYPWPITVENAPRQYRLARQLLAGVALGIVATFGAILVAMIRGARGEVTPFAWLLPAILLFTLAPIVLYFRAAYRAR